MKTVAGTTAAITMLVILISAAVNGALLALFGNSTSQPSQTALSDIPADYLTLYHQAATVCPGLNWTILAAIGKIETNHGRSRLPGVHSGENAAGAGGPMQFLLPTFNNVTAHHPLPPDGTTPPSRYNPRDAIYTAAYYLCDNGARHGDLQTAIYAYNHAQWYVDDVLVQAKRYAAAQPCGTAALSAAAQTAITFACAQLGLPYIWGGNGVRDGGFDCSGLTYAAYHTAGIELPRTAQTQYNTGPLLPTSAPLQPGDLLFYGTPAHIHHVGLYLGTGLMIDAPDTGQTVKIGPYRHPKDDYAGATRPANQGRFQEVGAPLPH
ncbi:MAG: bifunctional lytic transglycosylase/C40 family peptidase [Pseudonocardiales bacterium]|nr:bifunctional lytic transglycosylase/C40 family peptidase [Pseudonocardiales bacterium]